VRGHVAVLTLGDGVAEALATEGVVLGEKLTVGVLEIVGDWLTVGLNDGETAPRTFNVAYMPFAQ
jgi:hypothetical protein